MTKTKKIFMGIMISVMFMISMFSAIAVELDAESNVVVNNETVVIDSQLDVDVNATDVEETEVKLFANEKGAEIRLLQLKRSILRNIAHGEHIIEVVQPENVDELNSILDELQVISDSIDETEVVDKDQALESFLDIKEQVKELSSKFRETVGNIPKEERENLRKKLVNIKSDKEGELTEKINERRNHYNANRIDALIKKLGTTNTKLVEQIRNGELTKEEVRKIVSEDFKKLGNDAKNKAIDRLKEERAKVEIKLKEKRNELVKKQKSRLDAKEKEIKEKLKAGGDNIRENIKHKITGDSDRIKFNKDHFKNIQKDNEIRSGDEKPRDNN